MFCKEKPDGKHLARSLRADLYIFVCNTFKIAPYYEALVRMKQNVQLTI